jgi:serine/threonine protein kinase
MKKKAVPEHRARREMQLLQDLAESTGRGRDHVIQYRCIEEAVDKVLLGMELCECSLHDVVSVHQQRVPREHQIRITRELSEAVGFLHEHMIVHCDIRPKNILFKQGGFEGTVKLTDFGLSKEVDTKDLDQSFSTTTVQAGTEIGSFGYYAPEVYRHEKPTPKVDIFSLGCCIFYVISQGRRPFEDPDQRDNKYMMLGNLQSGQCRLQPMDHFPEAGDLVASMIAMEAKVRPSMSQVLDHPLFWSVEVRFQFLCAVGKEKDVVSNSASARQVLPPSLLPGVSLPWHTVLDPRVWSHYTDGELGRGYDTSSIMQLLRFMRNCEAHPPACGSEAQAVLVAYEGMANYFVSSCFPQLPLRVRIALAKQEAWSTRSGLQRFFRQQSQGETPVRSIPMGEADATARSGASSLDLEEWLRSIHPNIGVYAARLVDYGYDDVSFLLDATEDDLKAALEEGCPGMKPFHCTRVLKRHQQLLAGGARGSHG